MERFASHSGFIPEWLRNPAGFVLALACTRGMRLRAVRASETGDRSKSFAYACRWLLVVETLIFNIISQRAREMMTP